jgi:hypothetical protein
MLGEDLLKVWIPGDCLPLLEELHRLRLDRVRVRQVLAELIAEIAPSDLTKRRLDRSVKAGGEPLGHGGLLLRDGSRRCNRVLVAGSLGDDRQELVCGQLHVLIRVGMRDELARRVRLGAREQDHPDPAGARREILDLGRVRFEGVQSPANESLLFLRFSEVLAEGPCQHRVASQPRGHLHLLERLLLDRVDVREVLDELFLERVGHVALVPG